MTKMIYIIQIYFIDMINTTNVSLTTYLQYTMNFTQSPFSLCVGQINKYTIACHYIVTVALYITHAIDTVAKKIE